MLNRSVEKISDFLYVLSEFEDTYFFKNFYLSTTRDSYPSNISTDKLYLYLTIAVSTSILFSLLKIALPCSFVIDEEIYTHIGNICI